jgi:hypothetical protein
MHLLKEEIDDRKPMSITPLYSKTFLNVSKEEPFGLASRQ